MAKRSFDVTAVWDAEAKVWYSQSDIIGLHVEAETLPEFLDLVRDLAAELIVANHLSPEDIAGTPLRDLIPAVVIHGAPDATAAE
ncbi:MAG: DUF1902 domain-containing protein [Rhodobacter sp.]|nr:DUF1902 domain-containing protein [Rhodobacter sp.]